MAEESRPAASYEMGVTGLGKVTLSGTDEFVSSSVKHLGPIVNRLLEAYITKCINDEGMTREAAVAEFNTALDAAWEKAKAGALSVSIGAP